MKWGLFSIYLLRCLGIVIMIEVTKMDSRKMLINEALIETVEDTPDTVIRLVNGNKYIVKENRQQILEKIFEYQGLK